MMSDGTVIRDGHASQARPEQGLSSSEPSENDAYLLVLDGQFPRQKDS